MSRKRRLGVRGPYTPPTPSQHELWRRLQEELVLPPPGIPTRDDLLLENAELRRQRDEAIRVINRAANWNLRYVLLWRRVYAPLLSLWRRLVEPVQVRRKRADCQRRLAEYRRDAEAWVKDNPDG